MGALLRKPSAYRRALMEEVRRMMVRRQACNAVTLAGMATSTERARAHRERIRNGVARHACLLCGDSHYPCNGVAQPPSATPLCVSHDGQTTHNGVASVPTGEACPRCELARARLADAIAAGNALRGKLASYRAYGQELERKHGLALERIAALERAIQATGAVIPASP